MVPLTIEIICWSEVAPFVSPVNVFITVLVKSGSPGQNRPLGQSLGSVDVPSQYFPSGQAKHSDCP